MVHGVACVAVALLLAVSSVDGKSIPTYPALSSDNPVCTFGLDRVRVKGKSKDKHLPGWRNTIPCRGPQGYAIRPCQLKKCQCRKFRTHVVNATNFTTWAQCRPWIKDEDDCVGLDLLWCDTPLRGRDPLTIDKKALKMAASGKSVEEIAEFHVGAVNTTASGDAAASVNTESFPVVTVVLASIGVLLAIVVGTWLATSKKRTKRTVVITAPDTKDPQSLEIGDFGDNDHPRRYLYTDAQSTAAAVHTVAEPRIRRASSASVSSVSSIGEDTDDDDEEDKQQDTWTEFNKK
ncbi:hypothetical protein LEN26_004834 [Aphanomyces euteiches]|nr:hypothetical protein AeMF1_005422 [Aphanomyces euteiches]KAH9146983.1 hypothetical protein LEN26_004834 [Aphanomyces euteiches]KAH9187069.1 hypothetical protein AeNC1_010953 [Aphanomyces euteiches]